MLSLPCRPIRKGCVHNQATAWEIREDGAIREDRVMDPGCIRVRLQTRRQTSRRINGGAVVVEHKVRGWGMGNGGWVKLAPSPGIEPGSSP